MTLEEIEMSLHNRFPNIDFVRFWMNGKVQLDGDFTMEELIHIGMLLSIINECNKKEEEEK